MHASAVLLVAAAGLAAAQSSSTTAASTTASSTSTSGCGTQIDTIIASCLGTTKAQLSACATNDWDCMCTQTTNVLTCYNNCPSSPDRNGVLQQQTSYCNAAKAYSSSSSSATHTGTATGTATATAGSATASSSATGSVASSSGTGTGTATASGASATSSGSGAEKMAYPGAFAALFGLVALL
ncbi:Hypothetical predicted protein [Lecanosticta acicola]|uniref:GPI anchored serine-threonine rich protein n=1 Tax=Lecanosticta acicola TaxID=111012 RepID=A0AAI9EEM4_9PEZI|nr:Hypothetical predicted protein [Lecanosticta acicola]